ncbi:hypothetical protein KEM54_003254, partial [Ascosphaera aggregata]
MTSIKQHILSRWASGPTDVKICCIKFAQKIVSVQTIGPIADPRRPEHNETSLAIVPRNHPVLQLPSLQAEASGLLDRLLNLFYENSRNPGHPLNTKLHHCIERMAMSKIEMLEEAPRKRQAPVEPTDVVDSAKRARIGVETPPAFKIPPLPAGPNSVAQLFTLTEDQELSKFDVTQLPVDMLVSMTVLLLVKVDNNAMEQAIKAVQSRYEEISKRQAYDATKPKQPQEEEDDYEPEYDPLELPFEPAPPSADEGASKAVEETPDIALGPFVLPQPAPLSGPQATDLAKDTVQRLLGMISSLEQPPKALTGPKSTQQTSGFNRLAASSFDRNSWSTVLTRLATRGTFGLETPGSTTTTTAIGDNIRQLLYRFVLEDFRGRIDVAISWMSEEWYSEQVAERAIHKHKEEEKKEEKEEEEDNERKEENGQAAQDHPRRPKHYETWALKLLEGFLPYLDAKDIK